MSLCTYGGHKALLEKARYEGTTFEGKALDDYSLSVDELLKAGEAVVDAFNNCSFKIGTGTDLSVRNAGATSQLRSIRTGYMKAAASFEKSFKLCIGGNLLSEELTLTSNMFDDTCRMAMQQAGIHHNTLTTENEDKLHFSNEGSVESVQKKFIATLVKLTGLVAQP